MSQGPFEIQIGDVTDMEARVLARYTGAERVSLRGTIRGPYCESARTLPATFAFQQSRDQEGEAVAIVTDPCLWSAELPQLYHVDLEAVAGERVVAEYHGTIGLRRLAPRRFVDFAPGTG
jgi:Glycosyl hydrolases family 2